jgi:hypothetical protein
MLKNKFLNFVFFGVILVMLACGFFAVSLRTHAAAPSVSNTTTVHSYIIKTSGGVVFKQATLTTSLRNAFEFTNDTSVSQTVTYKGNTVVTVAAHSSAPYTFKAAGTYVFSLKTNTKVTQKVTVK